MFLVKKDDLIYEVKAPTVLDSKNLSLSYDLKLVCGHDYLYQDQQGEKVWVNDNRFHKDLLHDSLIVQQDESLKQELKCRGYKQIECLPDKIHSTSKLNETLSNIEMSIVLANAFNWGLETFNINSTSFWIPWEECGAFSNLEDAISNCVEMDEDNRVLWNYSSEDIEDIYENYMTLISEDN